MHEVFLCGNLKSRNNFEQLGQRGRIILNWILKRFGDVDWTHVAQERDSWLVVAKAVMNCLIA
jgi:hypothetical protein